MNDILTIFTTKNFPKINNLKQSSKKVINTSVKQIEIIFSEMKHERRLGKENRRMRNQRLSRQIAQVKQKKNLQEIEKNQKAQPIFHRSVQNNNIVQNQPPKNQSLRGWKDFILNHPLYGTSLQQFFKKLPRNYTEELQKRNVLEEIHNNYQMYDLYQPEYRKLITSENFKQMSQKLYFPPPFNFDRYVLSETFSNGKTSKPFQQSQSMNRNSQMNSQNISNASKMSETEVQNQSTKSIKNDVFEQIIRYLNREISKTMEYMNKIVKRKSYLLTKFERVTARMQKHKKKMVIISGKVSKSDIKSENRLFQICFDEKMLIKKKIDKYNDEQKYVSKCLKILEWFRMDFEEKFYEEHLMDIQTPLEDDRMDEEISQKQGPESKVDERVKKFLEQYNVNNISLDNPYRPRTFNIYQILTRKVLIEKEKKQSYQKLYELFYNRKVPTLNHTCNSSNQFSIKNILYQYSNDFPLIRNITEQQRSYLHFLQKLEQQDRRSQISSPILRLNSHYVYNNSPKKLDFESFYSIEGAYFAHIVVIGQYQNGRKFQITIYHRVYGLIHFFQPINQAHFIFKKISEMVRITAKSVEVWEPSLKGKPCYVEYFDFNEAKKQRKGQEEIMKYLQRVKYDERSLQIKNGNVKFIVPKGFK